MFDEETGLYYLRSRYYCSLLGRFVNGDTLVKTKVLFGCSAYTYCMNAPIKRIDSMGTSGGVIPMLSEAFPADVFSKVIRPRIMEYLQSEKDYEYHSNGYKVPTYKNGCLIKPGHTDCSHLMYEICGRIGSKTARYRYLSYKGPKGKLFNEEGDLNIELIEGMEVFSESKTHVGMLILHDFGDGLEWAVFQSASDEIERSKALFLNDTGPNITSLYRFDGTTQWVYSTYPQFVDYHELIE